MASSPRRDTAADVRAALLTNSLSPHTLPLCEGISHAIGEFHAFVSADSDTRHNFPRPRASFAITVQRSFNSLRLQRRRKGSSVKEQIHIPLDTYSQLNACQPDVIITCEFGARTLLAILYRQRHPNVRLIVWAALSSHTERGRSRFREALRRFILRHADAAFVNGRSGERYLRHLGFRRKVFTIPYAIDDKIFRSPAYAPDHNERRLFYCGRVDREKGILRFSAILQDWCLAHPDRSIRLQIVGDGSDTEAIRSLRTPANLKLSVLPRLDQETLSTHYHSADLFVFPSLSDEWGVVVNEAMAAGLPVLGSIYSQAVVELVNDGASGWLFDPHDRDNTYRILDRALTTDHEDLKRMSACALDGISQLSPHITSERAVQAITEVCGLEPVRRRAAVVSVGTLLESAHR